MSMIIMDDLPRCPKCGAKAFISHDISQEYEFGWSVGCPRYCHDDGIHGTKFGITAKADTYMISGLNSKGECVMEWKKRVKHLRKILKEVEE